MTEAQSLEPQFLTLIRTLDEAPAFFNSIGAGKGIEASVEKWRASLDDQESRLIEAGYSNVRLDGIKIFESTAGYTVCPVWHWDKSAEIVFTDLSAPPTKNVLFSCETLDEAADFLSKQGVDEIKLGKTIDAWRERAINTAKTISQKTGGLPVPARIDIMSYPLCGCGKCFVAKFLFNTVWLGTHD